jgi:hypothetical protein
MFSYLVGGQDWFDQEASSVFLTLDSTDIASIV